MQRNEFDTSLVIIEIAQDLENRGSFLCKAAETFDLLQWLNTTWGQTNGEYKHLLMLHRKQRKWMFAELYYWTGSNITQTTSVNLVRTGGGWEVFAQALLVNLARLNSEAPINCLTRRTNVQKLLLSRVFFFSLFTSFQRLLQNDRWKNDVLTLEKYVDIQLKYRNKTRTGMLLTKYRKILRNARLSTLNSLQ